MSSAQRSMGITLAAGIGIAAVVAVSIVCSLREILSRRFSLLGGRRKIQKYLHFIAI